MIEGEFKDSIKHWSKEWPTEPGWYWFCGWTTRRAFDQRYIPHLHPVKVERGYRGDSYYQFTLGGWTSKDWGGIGFFLPLETPEVPEMPRYDAPEEDL